jgi:glycerol-3-phosphate acyltransferase PlsY
MNVIIALLSAYLLGSIPFGYLLVRVRTGRDVRSAGSKSIGATNVLRTAGRLMGVVTLLLDAGKGYLAVWLAAILTGRSPLWMSAAAVAVMSGHVFPLFLKFKGGKAVASGVGAFLYLAPAPLAAALVVFVVTVAATRYISAGSILAAASLPLAAWLISHPPLPVLLAAVVAAVLIIWRHRPNLERLRAGEEHMFTFGGRHA